MKLEFGHNYRLCFRTDCEISVWWKCVASVVGVIFLFHCWWWWWWWFSYFTSHPSVLCSAKFDNMTLSSSIAFRGLFLTHISFIVMGISIDICRVLYVYCWHQHNTHTQYGKYHQLHTIWVMFMREMWLSILWTPWYAMHTHTSTLYLSTCEFCQ